MWNYVHPTIRLPPIHILNAKHPVSYSRFTVGYTHLFLPIHILLWRKAADSEVL